MKYFRPRLGRGFQNRAAYQHGRFMGDARTSRAVANKSRFGRDIEEALWVNHEFDMLCRLHFAGADVPTPLAAAGSAILMEFVGDEEGPAPQLRELRLTACAARGMLDRLIWNIERLLANNVIHADLSAYNILVHNGSPRIIDLPQAVDPRTNGQRASLLARDLDRVCRHFERFGVHTDAAGLRRRPLATLPARATVNRRPRAATKYCGTAYGVVLLCGRMSGEPVSTSPGECPKLGACHVPLV